MWHAVQCICDIRTSKNLTRWMKRHCFRYAVYGEEGNKLQRHGQHASDRKQDFVCLGKKHSFQWESKYGRNRKSQANKGDFRKVIKAKHQNWCTLSDLIQRQVKSFQICLFCSALSDLNHQIESLNHQIFALNLIVVAFQICCCVFYIPAGHSVTLCPCAVTSGFSVWMFTLCSQIHNALTFHNTWLPVLVCLPLSHPLSFSFYLSCISTRLILLHDG